MVGRSLKTITNLSTAICIPSRIVIVRSLNPYKPILRKCLSNISKPIPIDRVKLTYGSKCYQKQGQNQNGDKLKKQ